MKNLIAIYFLFLSSAPVFAVHIGKPVAISNTPLSRPQLPPTICPSWGCGAPPFKPIQPIPVKIDVPACPSWGCGAPPLQPISLEK
jgi:hypothetical protein